MLDDTIDTAYERAKLAQFRGLHTIDVVCDALGRTQKPIVEPFPGCVGFVRHRLIDEDGIPVTLIVRLDVADVLITARDIYIRSLTPQQPKWKPRKRSRSVMHR